MASESGSTQERRRLNLKTIQDAPSAHGETVGMELRAIRLQRGESVQHISDVLRIRKEMVEAIEHGRQDLLPGNAYAVGFMRAYSDYLRLDTADVVRRYKAEFAAAHPEGHFSMPVPEDEQRFSFVSVFIILLCIVAAAAGAWYLATQSGLFNRDRGLGPTSTADDTSTSTTPQPNLVEPAAPVPAPTPAAPGSTPDLIPPVGVAPTPPTTPPGTVPPEAIPVTPPPVAPPPAARPGGVVAPAAGETPQPATGKVMGQSNTNARIVFIARRQTFLSIGAGGQPLINRNLEIGDSYRVPRREGMTMDVSDAGGLDVMLDGEYIGRAGADGVPIKDFALTAEAYGAPAETPAPAAPPAPVPQPPAAGQPETPPAVPAATPAPVPQPTPGAVPPATPHP